MVHFLLWSGLILHSGATAKVSFDQSQRAHPDTVPAGSPAVSAKRLRDFSLTRLLTLTQGDSARSFGRQMESLSRTTLDGVQPFEWNVFGLAIAALPLHPGYRAVMPVYSDRSGRVAWYTVEVLGDTTLSSSAGAQEPAWEVLAKPDSTVPMARLWIVQQERVVSRVLVSEPGVSILYARP
jgi:hypothetical protein